MEAFKPEFAGKMNFYLSAVDDQLRHNDDQPSIGLLLCKERDRLIVEYALRDVKNRSAWRNGAPGWSNRCLRNFNPACPPLSRLRPNFRWNCSR